MKWIILTLIVLAAIILVQRMLFPESCSEHIERLTIDGNVAAADVVDCSTHYNE